MAERYGVRITPRALKDLEGIFDYIEAQSPLTARKVIRGLLDAIDGLERMPGRFNVPRTGYVKGRQIRSMPVPPYLVRYRIDDRRATVHVLRVRHGARRRP
jgi:addiction module RelE/StbE family toxin